MGAKPPGWQPEGKRPRNGDFWRSHLPGFVFVDVFTITPPVSVPVAASTFRPGMMSTRVAVTRTNPAERACAYGTGCTKTVECALISDSEPEDDVEDGVILRDKNQGTNLKLEESTLPIPSRNKAALL